MEGIPPKLQKMAMWPIRISQMREPTKSWNYNGERDGCAYAGNQRTCGMRLIFQLTHSSTHTNAMHHYLSKRQCHLLPYTTTLLFLVQYVPFFFNFLFCFLPPKQVKKKKKNQDTLLSFINVLKFSYIGVSRSN